MRAFFCPLRPLLRGWLLSFSVFGLLACVLVGQLALAVSMPLAEGLRMAARDWLPWALVAPLIFRLVRRLPLERERWRLGVAGAFHLRGGDVLLCNLWAERVMPPRFRTRWRRRAAPAPTAGAAPTSAERIGPPGPAAEESVRPNFSARIPPAHLSGDRQPRARAAILSALERSRKALARAGGEPRQGPAGGAENAAAAALSFQLAECHRGAGVQATRRPRTTCSPRSAISCG